MKRLADAIAHHPLIVLAVIALLSAPAAYYARRVTIDGSAQSLVQPDPAPRGARRRTDEMEQWIISAELGIPVEEIRGRRREIALDV